MFELLKGVVTNLLDYLRGIQIKLLFLFGVIYCLVKIHYENKSVSILHNILVIQLKFKLVINSDLSSNDDSFGLDLKNSLV